MCLLPWSWLIPCCKVSGSCSSFIPCCKVSGFLILLWSVLHGVWFPNPSLIRVARCLVSWSFFISCSKVFGFLILLYSVLQGVWSLIPDLFVLHGVWFPDPSLFRVAWWLVLWSFYIPCRKVTCFLILLFCVASWRCLVDHGWVLFCLVSKCVWFFDIALFHFAWCLVVVWYCSWFSNPAEFRLVHVWKVYVPCRNVFNEILWSCCVSFRNVVLFSDPAVLHFASCLVL